MGSVLIVGVWSGNMSTHVDCMFYWWVHVFPSMCVTSDIWIFKSPKRVIFLLDVSILMSLCWDLYKIGFLDYFEFSILLNIFYYWIYAPPELSPTVGQYMVMIMVLTLFFPRSSIHDHWPRFISFWHVAITLHDTSSTAMMAVPPLWNGQSELVTWLYPVLIILFLNHRCFLLYSLFMGIT